jgi:hypothetical protein
MDELRDNGFLESKLWRRSSSVLWENFFHGVKASSPLARLATLWKSQFRASIGLKCRQLGPTPAETYLFGIVALQVQSRAPMFVLGRSAQRCPREEKERNG